MYTSENTNASLECTKIKSIQFAPEADLIGASLPINEFTADILTDDADKIQVGHWAELYDDLDNLWASYWITYAEQVQEGIVRMTAKSPLYTLDGVKMPAVMYSTELASDIILACIQAGGVFGANDIDIDSSFNAAYITGFCPEQTARERLTWVLFAIGAYAKSFFADKIYFLPIDNTETMIPINMTFLRPTVIYQDYVTSVKAKTYSFVAGTPETTDEYVTDDDGVTYIVTESSVSLANPDVPNDVPVKEMEIDGVYLINNSNVSAILSHLSTRYFKRTEVEADVINNASYMPGDKVLLFTEVNKMHQGFIESASFSFGVQARSKLKLTACENVACAKLTIFCKYDGNNIGEYDYCFPVGYVYSVQVPFIDLLMNGHRYIFRPTTATVTGTMTSSDRTVTVDYVMALDYFEGILDVISVDEVTDSEGVVTIT